MQAVLAEIDALAARLKRRLAADAAPLQRLRCLNRFFFQELGFAGNVNDYYDPRNSYLHEVLRTRRGIPITLAVLYIELAQQIGLTRAGVSFPGHFLVKLRMHRAAQGEVVIDPFTGQSLSREELERAALHRTGAATAWSASSRCRWACSCRRRAARRARAHAAQPKEIHRSAEDWPRCWPCSSGWWCCCREVWEERRDRGLAYANWAARGGGRRPGGLPRARPVGRRRRARWPSGCSNCAAPTRRRGTH